MNELIINVNDLVHNIKEIKSKEKDDYTIIAVVKADAYGCGMYEYVKILKQNNINFFAVATYSEAIEFRKYFSDKLLLLTPYNDEKIISNLIDQDIIFSIESIKQAKLIDRYAKDKNIKVTSHIKVDTGLNRFGYKYNDVASILATINNTENIVYDGIYSHFSTSLAKNSSYSRKQYNRLIKVIDLLKENHIEFNLKHICNSSGYFKYEDMHLNASRIGSAFIGCAVGIKTQLKLIGLFHTKIIKVSNVNRGEYIGYANSYKTKKKMKIAIIPSGYYDGIGKTLIDQRFLFKSKLKRVLLDIKYIFKTNNIFIDNNKVIGQIGMHDTVIDITNKNINENDDIYFYVRPINIDSSIKRIYKQGE